MKQTYRILNYLMSLEVLIQAAVITWFSFGVSKYAEKNGSITRDLLEDGGFGGGAGLTAHAINGYMIIPAIALVLLVISFFARVRNGVKFAAIIFVLVIVQANVLPALAERAPAVGLLHGAVALAILAVSIVAARKAGESSRETAPA